jgi:hypothetical protein
MNSCCKIATTLFSALLLTLGAHATSDADVKDATQIHLLQRYDVTVFDQQIANIYRTVLNNDADLTARIAKVSHYFLDKPYLSYPLGEGPSSQFDQAPRYRTDGFDCQTYVETVLALAKANNAREFKKLINQIRYQDPGTISFVTRNHFTDLDWNTVNQRNGVLKDVTTTLGLATIQASTQIDKPAWFHQLAAERIQLLRKPGPQQQQQLLTQLHAQAQQTKPTQASIHYIPLSELYNHKDNKIIANSQAFAKIPNGAVVEIVRPNWDLVAKIGTHLNVSHLGFAIRTTQGLMFRQASSERQGVVEIPLEQYLLPYYIDAANSSVKGINIQVPV